MNEFLALLAPVTRLDNRVLDAAFVTMERTLSTVAVCSRPTCRRTPPRKSMPRSSRTTNTKMMAKMVTAVSDSRNHHL